MRSKAAFGLLLVALSGCAFIKNGTTQRVKFESNPPKAEIWLNGEKHPELTPATIELPRGELSYQIRKTGFDTVTNKLTTRTSGYFYWSLLMGVLAGGLDMITGAWNEFDIPEEDKDTIKVVLEPSIDSSEHIVAFSTNPPGASIKLGDLDLQERTGIKGQGKRVNVHWGGPNDQIRLVVLKYPGYYEAKVPLKRGEKMLHKELEPHPEKQIITFHSDPPGAQVLMNGEPIDNGITPFTKNIERRRGDDRELTFEFRKPGYASHTEVVKDKFNKEFKPTLVPKIDTIALKIDCSPAGADLEVDGRVLGAAPPDVKLDWSVLKTSYSLKFSRPGYVSQEFVINEAGKTGPLKVRLKPTFQLLP